MIPITAISVQKIPSCLGSQNKFNLWFGQHMKGFPKWLVLLNFNTVLAKIRSTGMVNEVFWNFWNIKLCILHLMSNDSFDIKIWHKSIWPILVSKDPSGPQQSHTDPSLAKTLSKNTAMRNIKPLIYGTSDMTSSQILWLWNYPWLMAMF